jgi:E3 ubiquitin-protein ligase MARCH6
MACRCAYTLAKVTAVLFMQLGVFPVLCGFWLDFCSLELFGSDVDSRHAFLDGAFMTCVLLHWLVGLIYMLYVSLFVSIMREFLRSDVLWFLRNPDDPDYHPFRELVQEPLWIHGRRIILSAVIYSSLIILLVWCPMQVIMLIESSLLNNSS